MIRPTARPRRGHHRRVAIGVLLSLSFAPVLAACNKPVGSTSVRDVAWVTTDASVTLPGMDVTPVDLAKDRREVKVPVGSLPSALAYTAGDRGLLVVTQGDDTLHEIDPATHDVIHSVTVGLEPDAVAVAPGGTHGRGMALVANFGSDTVTPVDLGTWRAGPPVPVGSEPVAIAVAPPLPGSGTVLAFVANFGGNTVTPINVGTMGTGAPIPVGPGPQTMAVASGALLVGNFGNATLTEIGASTLRPGAPVPLPFAPTAMTAGAGGMGPAAYVCGGMGVVAVTLTALGPAVGPQMALSDAAQGIALSADGLTAWVTQQAGGLVPVTLATGKTGPAIRLGGHPSAIVIGAG
ncbi:MAG TPA: YncE family protein [Acidimicrobiales bacterium]|nr:YncE family protein [Acidimicrobiales bacterium]